MMKLSKAMIFITALSATTLANADGAIKINTNSKIFVNTTTIFDHQFSNRVDKSYIETIPSAPKSRPIYNYKDKLFFRNNGQIKIKKPMQNVGTGCLRSIQHDY